MTTQTMPRGYQLADIPFTKTLFESKSFAWLWLIIRLYLGYQWIESGWGKIANPAWMQGGTALKGFWERALIIPDAPARPLIAFDWYRNFIQFMLDSGNYVWFAKLVTVGELLVGAALILCQSCLPDSFGSTCSGVEDRWLDRSGSLAIGASGHALAAWVAVPAQMKRIVVLKLLRPASRKFFFLHSQFYRHFYLY